MTATKMQTGMTAIVTRLLVLAALASVALSCAPRRLMIAELVGMLEDGLPAMEQEDDLNLLARSIPAHIKLLETVLVSDPRNTRLLNLLSRLYGAYAFALLETEWEARYLDHPSVVDTGLAQGRMAEAVARYYHTGAAYALQSLEVRHANARRQLNNLSTSAGFIRSLDRQDLPALFWYGFNLGGMVRHRMDDVEAMAKAHLVEKAMKQVVALNPAYDHGNANLVLLVYHASRPRMLGGDPEQARQYYRLHRQTDGAAKSLGDLLLARYLLVQQQDKAAFVKQLTAVPQVPGPGRTFTLLDRVAAVRARIYLDAKDRFFE